MKSINKIIIDKNAPTTKNVMWIDTSEGEEVLKVFSDTRQSFVPISVAANNNPDQDGSDPQDPQDPDQNARIYSIKDIYSMVHAGVIWGTEQREDAAHLFYNDTSLTIFPPIYTGSLKNMQMMFSQATMLKEVYITETKNVTDMRNLFYGCNRLVKIDDISKWNTSKVMTMAYMFLGCSSLQSLDVSSWDVSNVTNMSNMFSFCSSLQTLDCSNFVINEGVNTYCMFYNLSALTTLTFTSGLIDQSIALLQSSKLTMTSVDSIIGALSDRTGKTAKTLTLHSTVKNQMSAEQIALINSKNWTLA